MVKLKSLRVDPAAEAEGVFLEYVSGFRLRIASTATRKFRDAMEAAMLPYRELIRADVGKDKEHRKFTEQMRADLLREVVAVHVLIGWEGLEDDEGQPVPYSKAAALALLSDPGMHRLLTWIEAAAANEDVYRAERLECDRGNS